MDGGALYNSCNNLEIELAGARDRVSCMCALQEFHKMNPSRTEQRPAQELTEEPNKTKPDTNKNKREETDEKQPRPGESSPGYQRFVKEFGARDVAGAMDAW